MPAGISSRHLYLTRCRSVFYLLMFSALRPWFWGLGVVMLDLSGDCLTDVIGC